MKKNIPVIFSLFISAYTHSCFALSGLGTEQSPYLIQSRSDFDTVCNNSSYWDDHIRLEVNLDLEGTTYSRAPIASDPGELEIWDGVPFSGIFDGNGHVIRNLKIDTSGANNCYLGLFGYLHNGEIKSLDLEGVSITGSNKNYSEYVGALCGQNRNGTISYCSVSSVITSGKCDTIGGLCGYNSYAATIRNSYATGNISGDDNVGGFCGRTAGAIIRCYSEGMVSGDQSVGGFCSSIDNMTYGVISNCYSSADASGGLWVGGLVGRTDGLIANSFAIGAVSGSSDYGGFCGTTYSGFITNCFWDTESSGLSISSGGQGKSTEEMKQQSTFVGWDFVSVWNMPLDDYPDLQLASRITNSVPSEIETAVEIVWLSESNATYIVQWRNELMTNNWQNLTDTIIGTGEELSVLDSTRGKSNRFYRVISD